MSDSGGTVVLVEGASDRCALETLARRRGRDLDAERVRVVAIEGAKNIGSFLERLGPHGLDVAVRGLCDAREARDFQRGLERAGFGARIARRDLESLGFYVCVEDLEDELIRALGVPRVLEIVDAAGELAALRTFQRQPAQQHRPEARQLRRFMGTKSGRKLRYAALLVDALDADRVPPPLERLLDRL